MARITLNLHGTDGDQSVFRTALTEFLAEWPEHATIRDESRGDVYAETYEKMLDAKEHGEHVIIDMDPGMFRMALHEMERAIVLRAIKADRAQRPTPDTHCFREDSPTVRCSLCGWLAAAHTGCDCEEEEEN